MAKGAEEQVRTLQKSVAEARRAADAATAAIQHAVESNNISRQTMIAGQRPWIEVTNASLAEDMIVGGAGGKIVYRIEFRNVGRSPAVGLSIATYPEALPAPSPKTLLRGQTDQVNVPEPYQAVIFPGSETFFERTDLLIFPESLFVRDAHMKTILPVSISGFVEYGSAVSDIKHRTTFAFFLDSKTGALNNLRARPDRAIGSHDAYFRRSPDGWFAT